MSALAEIQIAKRENVLCVPVESILSFDGKQHVSVRKPDGMLELRNVILGISDGKQVEITRGLKSGESILMNPVAFMSGQRDDQKPTNPAERKARRKQATEQLPGPRS
jgi:hypothetical protein